MKILGISCYYHDAAACLIINGKITSAAAEERFTRIKHDNNFPINAINYCLNDNGLAANELDYIVFYEKPIIKFERIIFQHLQHFPKSYLIFSKYMSQWLISRLRIRDTLKSKVHYHGKILFIDHHLAHAACTYYLSGYQSSSILTIDGVGEWATCTVGLGSNNKIEIKKQINFPNSLGLLYSTFTTYLGFSANDAEYKVMGLAAYGKPKQRYIKKLNKIINVKKDGSFSLDMKYFDYSWRERMFSEEFIKLFKHPPRRENEKILKFHEDLAASLQYLLEKVVINLLNKIYLNDKNLNICMSGGVALNAVLNGKILANTPFKKLFIPPDPGDAGGAMGAALYIAAKYDFIDKRFVGERFCAYLGPEFKWFQIVKVLDRYKKGKQINYYLYSSQNKLLDRVADLIKEENIIGWFQGKMEWGPRALGNRSILASATRQEMRDIINSRVKNRELFRPFAPVIIENKIYEYFQIDNKTKDYFSPSNRWMLTVYPFKKSVYKLIPAVVHIDGSGRLQSLCKKDNALYYSLLMKYYRKTGIPVIINTSFNVKGEPIICTPEEAMKCFIKTDIDYLVIDRYLVCKVK